LCTCSSWIPAWILSQPGWGYVTQVSRVLDGLGLVDPKNPKNQKKI
jgi:hypothetical protein